jgi:hypothetical protein
MKQRIRSNTMTEIDVQRTEQTELTGCKGSQGYDSAVISSSQMHERQVRLLNHI